MFEMRTAAAALVLGIAACSPYSGGAAFHCETDAQCSGGPSGGRCELLTGFCSFADPACNSGHRYGSSSGGLSDVCVGDEPPGDGSVDSSIDSPPALPCFGTPLVACLTTLPSQALALPAAINTMTDCQQVLPQTNGPELCVIAGTSVTVPATTRVTGPRGLVVVSTSTITVDGSLDASSTALVPGGGANPSSCPAAGTGSSDAGGGAGGAGGGFATQGGDGGRGDENDNGMPAGKASGGVAAATQTTAVLRGGCRGGNGGDGNGGFTTGSNGGGAVYLIAASSITVSTNGGVYASGGGGGGGPACGGGGGGGSGGMIGFDAPAITIDGKVAANGGGGGGGGGSTGASLAGTDGTTTMYNTRAPGGAPGGGNGVAGGLGSALGNLTGAIGANGDCGGGGGGGGIGVVWTHGTVTGTQISPAPTAQ